MSDFYELKLWMFIVIGVFGYLLCFFRYKFVWWIVPVVTLVCVAFMFVLPTLIPPMFEFKTLTWFRIGFSMVAAIALPVAGALANYHHRHPGRRLLP